MDPAFDFFMLLERGVNFSSTGSRRSFSDGASCNRTGTLVLRSVLEPVISHNSEAATTDSAHVLVRVSSSTRPAAIAGWLP